MARAKKQITDNTTEIFDPNILHVPEEATSGEFKDPVNEPSKTVGKGKVNTVREIATDSSPNVLLILCDKMSKEVSNSLYSIPRKCRTDVYSGSEILRLSVMAKRKNRLSVRATFNSAGIDEKSFIIIESPKVYLKLLDLIPSMKLFICFIDEFDHEKMKQTLSELGLVVTGTEVFSTNSKLVGVTIPSVINYLTSKFTV